MIIPLRISIFVMMLVAIHININIENKQSRNRILTLLLITYLLHNTLLIPIWIISPVNLLYIDLAVPFSLMYGPLLFFYYKSLCNHKLSKITLFANLFPVIISWIAYFIFILNESIRIQTESYYYPILFGCIGVSFILYSSYIFIIEYKNKDHLFSFFSFFLILAGVFMMYLSMEIIFKKVLLTDNQDVSTGLTVTLFMSLGGFLILDLVFRLFKSQYQHKSIRNQFLLYNTNNERVVSNKNINDEFNKSSSISLDKELIENIFTPEYLVDKTMDLSKAASLLGMSQNKLQNLIYDYYDTTFSKLLTIKRIDYACKTILDNDTSSIPDNLYKLCGFKSMSTFYRNFKNLKGCSPSQYKT